MISRLLSWSRAHRAGVSLVELMITVAILGIGVIAALGSFRLITESIQGSKARTLSNNLAQEQIEKLKNLSYYMLLVTTSTYSDSRFSPALLYDTGNYPAQTIMEGGIRFTRATRVDFAYQNGSVVSTAPFTSNDTGLKLITTYVIWQDGNQMNHVEMSNLMANPAANPLNASFRGTVRDTGGTVLPGALVQVADNSNWYAFTNSAGQYNFAVAQGSYTLVCSTYGFFTGTTSGYQSIVSGQSRTVDFTLGRMSSGTATGYVYMNDHIVISQVVGSTVHAASGWSQEYVELYNPSTFTWTIASNPTTGLIDVKYRRRGSSAVTLNLSYTTLTLDPGEYYLIANTTPVRAVGVVREADAIYLPTTSDYPNVIRIDSDSGNDAAVVSISYAGSSDAIDRVGWKTAGNNPDFYEGAAIDQVTGLELNEQFVRRTHPNSGVITGAGRGYDTNDNANDFDTAGRQPMIYPPKNSTDVEPIRTGTPATGAYITVNDGLSQTGICNATTLGGRTVCQFNVPSIATGTWTLAISSKTFYSELTGLTITANVSTGVPNGSTTPTWTTVNEPVTILTNTTNYAFISGVIRDASYLPLSGISVFASGQTRTTATNGRYFIPVTAGDTTLIANYNNANRAYTSQSSQLTGLAAGQIYDNPQGAGSNITWFTLSLGGILSGYFRTGSNTPLPGRVAVALLGGSQAAQAVSGNDGRFYLTNLTTGTYSVQPALDPVESSNPSSVSVTLTSTGTTTTVSTFTITNGMGEITGQVLDGTDPITTGVLVLASTTTLSGGASSPPPGISGLTSILCNPCYYGGSSDSTGNYSLNVRSSSAPYKVYGWHTTFDGQTPTVTRSGPYSVTVSTAGQIISQNLAW